MKLKLAVEQSRQAKCSPCPHAVRHPTVRPRRKQFCGLLFNGDVNDRTQPAYLSKCIPAPNFACPIGEFTAAGPDDIAGPGDLVLGPVRITALSIFHSLWDEIHDPTLHWTPERWAVILLRLPDEGCECRRHARAYEAEHPIPYGDDVACHLWGHGLHNNIRQLQGKSLMPVDEFRERYR